MSGYSYGDIMGLPPEHPHSTAWIQAVLSTTPPTNERCTPMQNHTIAVETPGKIDIGEILLGVKTRMNAAMTELQLVKRQVLGDLAEKIQQQFITGWRVARLSWDGEHEYNDEGGTYFSADTFVLTVVSPSGAEVEARLGSDRCQLLMDGWSENVVDQLREELDDENASIDDKLAAEYGIPSEDVLFEVIAPLLECLLDQLDLDGIGHFPFPVAEPQSPN